MTYKPLKAELHHWWPKTLSRHWRSDDEMVSIIRPSGEIKRAPAGAFGAITNAHHLRMAGPWSSTFEPIFNQPDGEINDLVEWIFTIETSSSLPDDPMVKRIIAQPLPDERGKQVARIVASILARSPRTRFFIRRFTEHYRSQAGMADPTADKTLIAANQSRLYESYTKSIQWGRWAIAFSDSLEFVAGDGFFHNFSALVDIQGTGKKLILPFLPTVALIYMNPMDGYPSEPRLVSIRLSPEEVERINFATQVYSQDILFFRSSPPILHDGFKMAEFGEFKYNQDETIDALLDSLSQYNHWGRDGTPSIRSVKPYTDSIINQRNLDELVRRSK